MNEAIYVALEERGILAVGGAEAVPFLQGLVSNDVERAARGAAVYAALLTPQGKFLHDFMIVRHGESLLLECEADRLMDLGQRLAAYKLRADVSLADASEDHAVFALPGADGAAALGLALAPGDTAPWAGGLVLRDPRAPELGVRAILPRAAGSRPLVDRGLRAGTVHDYERLRLTLGVPAGSRDIEVGKATLMESNFEALGGIDFEKGCYVGQEITARMKYRGLARKRLLPVSVDGTLPPPGTPITAGGQEVGEIRSGLEDRALALLRLERVEAAHAVGLVLIAGEAEIAPAPHRRD